MATVSVRRSIHHVLNESKSGSDSRPLSFLGSFAGTTYRDSSEDGALRDVLFQTAIIVLTKKELNRHYHVMTSVNPRDPNVKEHRLAHLTSKEEHRKNKLISVGTQKVVLEVVT